MNLWPLHTSRTLFEKLTVVRENSKLAVLTERKCMLHLFTCSDYSATGNYPRPLKDIPLCSVGNLF
jgi:hypothetical protein